MGVGVGDRDSGLFACLSACSVRHLITTTFHITAGLQTIGVVCCHFLRSWVTLGVQRGFGELVTWPELGYRDRRAKLIVPNVCHFSENTR